METTTRIILALSVGGGVALLLYLITRCSEILYDKRAIDISTYQIIQKSNGKYYRIQNGKNEWGLRGDTLEEAKKSLEKHVEWQIENQNEKKSKNKIVWRGSES